MRWYWFGKFEVGTVTVQGNSEEDIITRYFEKISNLLKENKIDEFCALIGNDYLEYYNYTLDDVKASLQERNIIGKQLELANAYVYTILDYANVYYLELKSPGEVYSLSVIIRENAPEDYTIALDKFIDYKTNTSIATVNSVELQVLERARFTTNVEYRVRITNNYHDAITLNTNKTASNLVLVASNGKFKKPVSLSLAGAETIPSGQSREYDVTYNISEDMDYLLYSIFVLKDVSYTGMSGVASLEYYMTK